MLQSFDPYRPITIFVLIISYVWIVFQYPIQDALHTMVHIQDIQQKQFIFHSHDDNNPGHFHRNLILLKEIADANNGEESPQADFEIKKKIEIVDLLPVLDKADPPYTPPAEYYLFSFSSPFINVNSPPPWQV